MKKIKLQVIEDWRNAWKWISVNAMIAAGAIQGAWLQMPDDLKAHVPPQLVSGATIALLVLGVVGRLIKQGASDDKQPTN